MNHCFIEYVNLGVNRDSRNESVQKDEGCHVE